MDKKKINDGIPRAYDALSHSEIAINGKIRKTFRGQIATLGAAIQMGSLLPAIAFFSADGKASTNRSRLLKAICEVLKLENPDEDNRLYRYAADKIGIGEGNACKEDILNAAISLKLAMNLYQLVDDKQNLIAPTVEEVQEAD